MAELAGTTSADAPSRSRDLSEADKDALQRAQGLFDEGVSLIRVSRCNSQANYNMVNPELIHIVCALL